MNSTFFNSHDSLILNARSISLSVSLSSIKAYDVTFVETSFSYSYNYTDDLVISTSRRLLQQLPTAAPTPFPSLLRSDSPSKAPSTMAPTSSPTEKPFYLWFVSFDVTQSLANSGHLSAVRFILSQKH